MSLYVPQMQQSNIGAYRSEGMANVAKSFLDGVRISNEAKHRKNMQENELKRIDLQNRQLEADKQFRDRAINLQERAGDRQAKMFDQAMKSRADSIKATKEMLRYKMADSEAQGQVNKEVADLPWYETGFEKDPDEKSIYIFAKDVNDPEGGRKFWQNLSQKDIAKANLKREGVKVDPKIDPSLIDMINDPQTLRELGPYFSAGHENQGNYILNALINEQMGR